MTNLYEDGDYENALKQKNRMKLIYFIVLGIGLAACAAVYVLFLQLPYQSTDAIKGQKNLYLFLEGLFSFLIPLKRASAYYGLLNDIRTGQKQKNVSTFLSNEEDIETVRNVDFRVMIVLEWSDKTQEYMRRHVLVDKEKPMPELNNGDIITYVTHANVLLSYGLKSEEDVFDAFEEDKKH